MSNSTKAGRIDRRIPVPGNGVFVVDELDKVYRGSVVYDRAKMEVEAIRSAYDHLERKDQETIKGFVDKFDSKNYTSGGGTKIKGFGITTKLLKENKTKADLSGYGEKGTHDVNGKRSQGNVMGRRWSNKA